MSLSTRPHPIITHGKTTNIYLLVIFRTDSWCRPWGGCRAFTPLVIRWPTFPPSSAWRVRAIRFALARWSFPRSHLLGCWFLPSLCHSRPSSKGVWTSSPTSLVYSASARRHLSRRSLEGEHPPPALGHSMTSTSRYPRFASSPCLAQTPQ